HAPPRNLQSFPTRRSSDLEPKEEDEFDKWAGRYMKMMTIKEMNGKSGGDSTPPWVQVVLQNQQQQIQGLQTQQQQTNQMLMAAIDRKSTRLNSSHLVISYA